MFLFPLQSLWLFRLSAELEAKAAALRLEALQHMTIALAGCNCKELFTLLITFFGKDTGIDPFSFLNGAPKIKPPLDLTDKDTEDETGDASSTASAPSTSAKTPAPPPLWKAVANKNLLMSNPKKCGWIEFLTFHKWRATSPLILKCFTTQESPPFMLSVDLVPLPREVPSTIALLGQPVAHPLCG